MEATIQDIKFKQEAKLEAEKQEQLQEQLNELKSNIKPTISNIVQKQNILLEFSNISNDEYVEILEALNTAYPNILIRRI